MRYRKIIHDDPKSKVQAFRAYPTTKNPEGFYSTTGGSINWYPKWNSKYPSQRKKAVSVFIASWYWDNWSIASNHHDKGERFYNSFLRLMYIQGHIFTQEGLPMELEIDL